MQRVLGVQQELLAAQEVLRAARPDSAPEQQSMAQALLTLYSAWQAAEPQPERAEQVATWRAELAELKAASARP